jgi:hypothetical protein
VPVDAAQDVVGGRVVAAQLVVPGEVEQRPVALVGRAGQALLEPPPEVVEEPQL